MKRTIFALLPTLALLAGSVAGSGDDTAAPSPEALARFEARVRPVFLQSCTGCHGPTVQQAGLRLDRPISLEVARKVAAAVRPDAAVRMPPSGALRPDQIAAIGAWVADGAPWPARTPAPPKASAQTLWSLRPLRRPAVPKVPGVRHPIDAFVQKRLSQERKRPAPLADRRTLIRRVTFDLTGLPPTPAETDAFVRDTKPGAWERVIDRLLASPRYGEAWGRRWLDVVRYADTAGENSDHPLPHAWRYRNWVIDAFNRNLPYDRFIQDQVAGDLFAAQAAPKDYADRVVATGFLALARRFGHDIDQDVHLTYEDAIDTLGKSVLGLTIGCARCHDHKFDPIPQRDYYRLYGIFDSTRLSFPGCEPKQQPRDLVPLVPPQEQERRNAPLKARAAALDTAIRDGQATLARAGQTLSERARRHQTLLEEGKIPDSGKAALGNGLGSLAVRRGDILQISIGPQASHGADTTRLELSITEVGGARRRWSVADLIDTLPGDNPHPDRFGHPATWCFLDTQEGLAFLPTRHARIDGIDALRGWSVEDTPSVLANRADQPVDAWTRLPARSLFVHPGPKGPVTLAWISPLDGTVAVTGSVADAHPGGPDGVSWSLVRLHDDAGPIGDALAALGAQSRSLIAARTERGAIDAQMRVPLAFAVSEGTPHDARIHRRGDPADPGDPAPRGFLAVLGGQSVQNPRESGRRELARWLTAPANPLTPRVWANRVWQGHFGRGLVATPNDFGTRGAPPTDPALLDWLASELVRTGWNTKALHRTILTSAAYRRASGAGPAAGVAAFARRRLCAEELRDSLLFVTGELDPTPGEAHPFPPEAGWAFTQHAPFAAEYDTLRRSVYVLQKRNRRDRFFALFDGADPNASTPVRDNTTVPTQALYFLNDPFVHARADAFARRIAASAPRAEGQVDAAWKILYGHPPTPAERAETLSFLKASGWAATARVLLAGNEFLYVD